MVGANLCCIAQPASWRLPSTLTSEPLVRSWAHPTALVQHRQCESLAITASKGLFGSAFSRNLPCCPLPSQTLPTQRASRHGGSAPRLPVRCSSASPAVAGPAAVALTAPPCILAVVGQGSASPLQGEPWEAVMAHMAQRLLWTDPSYALEVVLDRNLLQAGSPPRHLPGIVVLVGISDIAASERLASLLEGVPTLVALDCGSALQEQVRLAGSFQHPRSVVAQLLARLPWGPERSRRQLAATIGTAWGRNRADDVLFGLLLLIDAFVQPVPQLAGIRAQDLATLQRMATKCGPQIWECVTDASCKKALDCLNECPPNDQVCSYRCIVTYESPLLEAFSLCILQKHNCLGLSAEPPSLPDVQPMAAFRGQPLSHDTAEDIFVGWLRDPHRHEAGRLAWSWRVVAGVNAAYDSFPCQYQIFYRGKARGSLWYDPVFKVKKLETEQTVWRRRHYRVRRATTPGTFYFSVLDNGVISKEYWRIVDCTDDLSWALFYYAGAASAAGQAYSGAVLVTPDGAWPSKDHEERLCAALDAAGIKLWELYRVDNRCCNEAPLDISPEDLPSQGIKSSIFP